MRDAFHAPVLADAVAAWAKGPLAGDDEPARGTYVDATVGGGGHAARILEACRPARAVLLDRDPEALDHARARLAPLLGRTHADLIHAQFAHATEVLDRLGLRRADFVLADLGVSSHQLDTPGRGFSFRADAPLDMRMDPTSAGPTAAEIVAGTDADGLEDLLRRYGDEPHARAIARALVRDRPATTGALVRTVESAVPPHRRPRNKHVATRTFQALRIAVNRELDQLDRFLDTVPERLAPGGRLCVVTYHSLEDRRVKRRFRALSEPPPLPRGLPVAEAERRRPAYRIPPRARGGIVPDAAEIARNPRARSARLRVLERRSA